MSRFRPVIRVFVSSTFTNLKEERNVLQREVFPRLEQYCLIRGFQFQAIDLRWGTSWGSKRLAISPVFRLFSGKSQAH
jgi:hypothetical protein